jgi:membrane associated rhomboid family serine protease
MSCYQHPDRRAGVRCQRCDRPICPSCMSQASVGFHCPECVRSGKQRVLTARHLRTRPIVTQVIVAACVAAAVFEVVKAGPQPNGQELVDLGALFAPAVDGGEWWRLFTVGFLHANAIHLGFNMLVLWRLGAMLEPALGRVRFAAVYVVSLLAGSLGVLVVEPLAPTVGASAAVFGLVGAAVVAQRAQGVNPLEGPLGGLLMINLLFTFLIPGISIGGHLGGLAGGLASGWVLVDLGPRLRNRLAPLLVCAALAAACVAAALWAAAQWQSRL